MAITNIKNKYPDNVHNEGPLDHEDAQWSCPNCGFDGNPETVESYDGKRTAFICPVCEEGGE